MMKEVTKQQQAARADRIKALKRRPRNTVKNKFYVVCCS